MAKDWLVKKKNDDDSEDLLSGWDTKEEAIDEANGYPRNLGEVIWVVSPDGDTVHTLKDLDVKDAADPPEEQPN